MQTTNLSNTNPNAVRPMHAAKPAPQWQVGWSVWTSADYFDEIQEASDVEALRSRIQRAGAITIDATGL